MDDSKTPVRTCLAVYVALLALLAATTGLAFVNLPAGATAVAMAIAGLKAALVALYFMHLRWSSGRVWILAGAGVYVLGILFVLTLNDVGTRSWLSPFLPGPP